MLLVIDEVFFFNILYIFIHSVVTLLGTLVQFNVVQYNSSAMNFTFTEFIMFSLYFLCLKCVNSIICFNIEVTVKGGVVLDYITLKGISNFLSALFINMRRSKYYKHLEYYAVQYNNTADYDLSAKCRPIHTYFFHILVYIIVQSIIYVDLFSFVLLVRSCYVYFCASTLRAMSQLPCMCTHTRPSKLILTDQQTALQ